MKNIFKTILFSGLLIILFAGCKHEQISLTIESENFRSATDFINNNYDLTIFAAAIEQAGLSEELRQKRGITIFAPSDAAFRTIGINSATAIREQMDPEALRRFIQGHITENLITSGPNDIPQNSIDNQFINLNGDNLYLAEIGFCSTCVREVMVNGSLLASLGKDFTLTNGILHMINTPIKYGNGNIQDFLAEHAEYQVFCEMLKKIGYWDRLAQEDNMSTVFAVTDEKLATAGITLAWLNTVNPEDYRQFLFTAYVFPGHILSQDVNALFSADFLPGFPIDGATLYDSGDNGFQKAITKNNGGYPGIFIYDIRSVDTRSIRLITASNPGRINVECSNGVVHELNDYLVSPTEARK